MRILLYLMILLSLFLFIFFKSNTWQTHQETIVKGGIEYYETRHSIHWDRFFECLRDIPADIYKSIFRK